MKYFLLLPVLLALGCVSIPPAYEGIECVNPNQASKFVYSDFKKIGMIGDDVIVLDNGRDLVYYSLPKGTACKISYKNEQGDLIERE